MGAVQGVRSDSPVTVRDGLPPSSATILLQRFLVVRPPATSAPIVYHFKAVVFCLGKISRHKIANLHKKK